MSDPLVVVTGFGAFFRVARNASREVARALEREPPPGVRVHAAELPVTFSGAAGAWDAILASLEDDAPVALLGLGVHTGSSYRLERGARGVLSSRKPDNEGVRACRRRVGDGIARATGLDLVRLEACLRRAGARRVRVSHDAGGFLCECSYQHLLRRAAERGIGGLFLHLPPARREAPADQAAIVRPLVAEVARQSESRRRGRAPASSGADAANARIASTKSSTARPM